jgi:hypothetical protein
MIEAIKSELCFYTRSPYSKTFNHDDHLKRFGLREGYLVSG